MATKEDLKENIDEQLNGQDNHPAEQESQSVGTLKDNEAEAMAEEPAKEEELSVEDQLAKAQEEIAQLNDRLLRQMAEFDNYRKRTLKEKTELILNGGEKVITSLLPILDDFDRAFENMDKTEDVATLKEGVSLIVQKFTKALSSQGLKRMETSGQEFNTDFHEAIALVPATEEAGKNHIIDCVQPGYLLNEKVIRHAKVVVGQ